MTFFSFAGLLLFVSSLIMSMIMIMSGTRLINILWFGLCVSMSFLGLGMYQIGGTHDPVIALFWWKFAYVGIINTPLLVWYTSCLILNRRFSFEKEILFGMLFLTIVFHYLNFRGIFINNVEWLFGELFFDLPLTTYFQIFFLYFNSIFTWIFYLLIAGYRASILNGDSELKNKILFFGIGISAGAIGGYALYLPLFGIEIYPYASLLMSLYPVFIGYSIIRHHLFDAKYAGLQVLKIFMVIVGSLGIGGCVLWGAKRYLEYIPQFDAIEFIIYLVTFIVSIILYRSKYVNRFFLMSSLIDLDREAEVFMSRRGVWAGRESLMYDVRGFFERGLRISRVDLITDTREYPQIRAHYESGQGTMILSELRADNRDDIYTELIRKLETLGEVVFGLEQADGDRVLLVIGPKKSEDSITTEELRIIHRILPKISLGLQVLDYHHTLQEEVQRQTRELQDAYQKLQDIDKNKDNFLAIASHELRTPMTIIKGYSDLFLQNTFGPMNPDARAYMQKIYNNTEALIELVNNILDISKIEAGRFEIVKKPVIINDTISRICENFENLYREKGVSLKLTNNSTGGTIVTDDAKYGLICTNLLSNAYKFTSTGGHVEVTISEGDSKLYFSVTDSGKGIEPERLPHVFEKFNQSTNTDYTKKSIHGTGLGLHLCKQIVELLGGEITATSTIDIGSSFTFYIPLSYDTVTP